MPKYNITLDDISPVWNYQGQWKDQDKGDNKFNLYSNTTFHATNKTGASVSISFHGTGVYLYGAFRGNHDAYSVAFDGGSTLGNGYHPEPVSAGDFQLPLFGRDGLDAGQHDVVLTDISTDAGKPWLDLDHGIITLGDGNSDTKYTDTILDDNHPNITYAGEWQDSVNDQSQYYWGQTMHRVVGKGARATISFYGNAITVFGATSGNHGPYTVSLDGDPTTSYTGRAAYFHAQVQLYIASGLEMKDHTLVVTHDTDDPDIWLDIDYAVASVWEQPTTSGIPASGSSSSKGSSTPVGAIAGGVAGGVIVLAAIGLLIFFLLRRRRRARESEFPQKSERDPSPLRHARPPLGPGARQTPPGGYGNAGLGAGLAGGAALGPGMQQRYGSGPESDYGGSTLASGSEAAGSTLASGSQAGNQRRYESLMGHVDLPPPGYDQVLRNSPATTPGAGVASLAHTSPGVASSSASMTSSGLGTLPSPVRSDFYTSGTGYIPPTKGADSGAVTRGSRPLPYAPM